GSPGWSRTSRAPWSIRPTSSRAPSPRWAARISPTCCRPSPAPISGSAMTARCRCTIRATCSTTRFCRSAPACSPASSKPACRSVAMHKRLAEEEVTSLHDLSATDLIAGYRAKQFSPSEVLEDVLAHVEKWEPQLKALYAFDPDGAREAAKASTARWSGGEPTGLLDGVPVTIKDNIATKGQPVPLGAASVKLVP